MNVLLIGSGGREHALAWKLAQSPSFDAALDTLYAAPGNPGIAEHATIAALDVTDTAAVLAFCADKGVGFVVIGPEAPLVAGLGNALRAAGLPVFGPDQDAARLEGSKGFTKDVCAREGIPTAGYDRVTSIEAALAALDRHSIPVVVKADGLAAGKGVTVAETRAQAEDALRAIFADAPKEGGAEAVIEEFLEGEEASLFVLTDGTTLLSFGSAQDHKRVGDGDTGPNTGGMGAYSPARILTPALEAQAMAEIIAPTVRAMAAMGCPYSGVLFAGLMLTADGPKLIEYNARFGDPECQVLMMRFQGDLLALLLATARGTLDQAAPLVFSDQVALTVVMAAAGYPATPQTGGAIHGLDTAQAGGARVFQAGTRLDGDQLVAAGGRVLAVTAMGDSVASAQATAYAAVDAIDFATGFARSDIGWREIAREAEIARAR
jgi:phosphoribosylamine--glycine ligase